MNYLIKDNVVYKKGTLAHFLDKRDISIGEPKEEDLPTKVNPFYLVYEQLLKNNCSIIMLQHSEMVYPNALLSLVNTLVPVEQAVLFYINVDDLETQFSLSGETEITGGAVRRTDVELPLVVKISVTVSKLEAICDE